MEQFKGALKAFIPILRDAHKAQLNESDTRTRIRLFLEKVLGYDILKEVTAEHQINGHYVDLTVKIKDDIKYLIEAKAVGVKLRDTHNWQAVNYAAQSGVKQVVLTNGVEYRLYSVSLDSGKVESDMVFEVDVLADPLDDCAGKLWLLSKPAVKQGFLDKYIVEATSLSDKNLLHAMMSDRVLNAIRLELKEITSARVSNDAIVKNIRKLFAEDLYHMVKERFDKAARKEKRVAAVPDTAAPIIIEAATCAPVSEEPNV